MFGKDADISRVYVQARLTRERSHLDVEWDGEKK